MWQNLRRRWIAYRSPSQTFQALYQHPLPAKHQPAAEIEWLSLDLELTGLDSASAEIVSLGWIIIRNNVVVADSARHVLVQTPGGVGDSATVHGIHDYHQQTGLTLRQALDCLLTALPGRVLLFHHAGLDLRVLNRCVISLYQTPLLHPYSDTMALEKSRRRLQGTPLKAGDLTLDACRRHYNLPKYQGHNAVVDALATAELFLAQISHMGGSDRITFGELARC